MSSQHLEEADELSDRICILTKGQLLALDTPDNIKRQFGVGYKLLIEPKTDKISSSEFISLRSKHIDVIIEEFKQFDVNENHESSVKKLIFEIPFAKVHGISHLLEVLEAKIGD